jgi:predicted metal-dependent hydrolase
MSESTAVATGLTSQYIAQVAGDLESNFKEQERIGTDIAALQQQLAALQQDHSVLVNIQRALGVTHEPDGPSATAESAAVPSLQQKPKVAPPNKRRARKTTAVQETTAKKPAAHTPMPKTGTTKAQPTLVELIRRHLAEQNEPRSAAEISTALSQAHPERGIKTKVVRVTTEGLVAKSKAQRTKQGASVFYTAPTAPEPKVTPQTEEKTDDTDR